jgi:hypothetical protein
MLLFVKWDFEINLGTHISKDSQPKKITSSLEKFKFKLAFINEMGVSKLIVI